ncbi:hypothetical protein H0H87_007811, partial [Tephrocybe sp. NHM501043]
QRGLTARPTKILFATSIAAFLLGMMNVTSTVIINAWEIKAVLLDSAGTLDGDLVDQLNLKLVAPQLLSGWANQAV